MNRHIVLALAMMALPLGALAKGSGEAGVAAAAEKLRLAIIAGDSSALEAIALPGLSYGHSGGHVDDKREFVTKLTSGKSDFVTMDISEQTISLSKNVAVLRHRLHAETADKGTPGTVDLLVMMVWQKTHGSWKLLARQAVKAK